MDQSYAITGKNMCLDLNLLCSVASNIVYI